MDNNNRSDDGNDILQRIINENGSCTGWANQHTTCKRCPMSRLKKRDDGNWLSCADAVGVNNLTEEQADDKYKKIAIRLLLDEAVEDLLIDDESKT